MSYSFTVYHENIPVLEYQAVIFGYGLKLDYEKLLALLEEEEKSRVLDVLYLQLDKYKKR